MKTVVTLIGKSNYAYFKDFIPDMKGIDNPLSDELLMFGAICENLAVGVLLLGVRGDFAEITWLFVHPNYRRRGVASALLSEVMRHADRLHIASFFMTYASEHINGPILDQMLLHHQFQIQSVASYDYRIPLGEFVQKRGVQNAASLPVKSSKYQFMTLENTPKSLIIHSSVRAPYDLNVCRKDLSILAFCKNTLAGVFLVREKGDRFNVEWLESYTKDPVVVMNLLQMACFTAVKHSVANPNELGRVISFQCIGTTGRGMVEKLFVAKPTEIVWFHRAIWR